jgi:hypothetical protein
MAGVKLVLDGAKMAELLRSPTGPVGIHMIERGEIVKQAAKAKAPRRTGCLEETILKRVEENAETGFVIRIVSDSSPCSPSRKSYSLFVHNGADPHDIPGAFGIPAPFGVGGRFSGRFHPGNRANPYLLNALPLAAA